MHFANPGRFPATRIAFALGALLATLGALPRLAPAQVSWAIAEREDAQIISLVGKLTPFVEKLPGQEDAAAVVLFSQNSFDLEEKKTRACPNLLLEIRDPAQVPERLREPYLPPGITIESIHAALLRDGQVQKLAETQKRYEPGREDIGRGRARFDWPELKKGDILVQSIVFEFAGPLPSLAMPVAEIFPSVITNLTIHGNYHYAYEVEPVGFESSDLDVKKSDVVDGHAKVMKASVNARPAYPGYDPALPLPNDVPHLRVRLTAVHFQPPAESPQPDQWIPLEGWNQLALQMIRLPEALAEDAGNTEVLLSALTTGKTEPTAKADAIYQFVHTKVARLEGQHIERDGVRPLSEVISAKEGTPAEQALLMAVLLKKAEVPFQIGLVRDPRYGPLDRDWPGRSQFTDMVLKVGDRYYAPQGDADEGNTYPASWSGATLFLTVEDLAEKAKKETEGWRKEAMAAGRMDQLAMVSKLNRMHWHEFAMLP